MSSDKSLMLLTILTVLIVFPVTAQKKQENTSQRTVVTPTWMPNGKAVILSSTTFDLTRKHPPYSAVYKLDLKTGQIVLLIDNAMDAVVSPNQKKIAFARQHGSMRFHQDLYLFDLKHKKEIPLLTDSLGECYPSWSPDSRKIVYNVRSKIKMGPQNMQLDIHVIDIRTKEVEVLTNNAYKNYNPIWESTGDKIIYFLEKGDNRDQIYLTDSKGSFHRNLTADTTAHNYYPSWYKEKIIFIQEGGQLVVMNNDGTNKYILLDGNITRAFYNSKVNKILYVRSDKVQSSVYTYDPSTKEEKIILTHEQIQLLSNLKTD